MSIDLNNAYKEWKAKKIKKPGYCAIGDKITLSDGNTYKAIPHPETCIKDSLKSCADCAFKPGRVSPFFTKLCGEVLCAGTSWTDGEGKRIFKKVTK